MSVFGIPSKSMISVDRPGAVQLGTNSGSVVGVHDMGAFSPDLGPAQPGTVDGQLMVWNNTALRWEPIDSADISWDSATEMLSVKNLKVTVDAIISSTSGWIYLGSSPTTDNSWRVGRNGVNTSILIQQRVSGSWETKFEFIS